jgi:hypothetical protein
MAFAKSKFNEHKVDYNMFVVCELCLPSCMSYSLSDLFSNLQSPDEIIDKSLHSSDGSSICEDFVSLVQTWLSKIQVLFLGPLILFFFFEKKKIYCMVYEYVPM